MEPLAVLHIAVPVLMETHVLPVTLGTIWTHKVVLAAAARQGVQVAHPEQAVRFVQVDICSRVLLVYNAKIHAPLVRFLTHAVHVYSDIIFLPVQPFVWRVVILV